MSRRNNDGKYCPICGRHYLQYNDHRCPKKSLAGIDSANERASDYIDAFSAINQPSLDEKLAFGFAIMKGEETAED